jgi:hypothetical protein
MYIFVSENKNYWMTQLGKTIKPVFRKSGTEWLPIKIKLVISTKKATGEMSR